VALGVVLLALALLVGSRRTSAFAVRQIEVAGASPGDASSVRRALEPLLGTSLASVDRREVLGRLQPLPIVTSASFDRSFPHTLKVFVRTERPLAVLRRGAEAWIVSAHGRVLRRLRDARAARRLPRIWLPHTASIGVDRIVSDPGRAGVAALAPAAGSPFLRSVRSVTASSGQVTLALRSGLQLRLGPPTAVGLKLAIARRIAPGLEQAASSYLDLTAPERPVVGGRKARVAG